jgi:uncharacterized protein (DUF58 family)
MLLPSRRLLQLAAAGSMAALAVFLFPGAWLLLLVFNLVLVLAALLDWLLTPRPVNLEVVRLAPEVMGVLEENPVALLVRNQARVALRVRLRDSLPAAFTTTTEEVADIVPAAGELRLHYAVTPATRGAFSWGPIHLRYRSLLGLWERQRSWSAPAETRVYPNVALLERYHLLARTNRLDLLGIRRLRLRGAAWEFESLRDYANGDDMRLIDWKATARRRKTIVRNQEAERNQTLLLLIDSGRLMTALVDGAAKLDYAVNAALVLAHVALGRGDRVGLCTFSHKVHAWVAPRTRGGQMRLLADALYDLRGDNTESDHGRCLRTLAGHHSKRALLVVLTDFVDLQTSADMIAHLRLAVRRHLVLFAALNDPLLERAVRSRPVETLDGFRKAAAVDLLHERREVLERLRQRGAHVLDTEPGAVTGPLINEYLEIASRGLL